MLHLNFSFSSFSFSPLTSPFTPLLHVRIQRGGGRRGFVPAPWKITKIKGFLAILVRFSPVKSQSYRASFQCWAIISTPAKCHLNGVLLAGRWWPAYSGIWILPPLINLKKNVVKGRPLWQNFLDPRMYCMICTSVHEGNPQALASGLSPMLQLQDDKRMFRHKPVQ